MTQETLSSIIFIIFVQNQTHFTVFYIASMQSIYNATISPRFPALQDNKLTQYGSRSHLIR